MSGHNLLGPTMKGIEWWLRVQNVVLVGAFAKVYGKEESRVFVDDNHRLLTHQGCHWTSFGQELNTRISKLGIFKPRKIFGGFIE